MNLANRGIIVLLLAVFVSTFALQGNPELYINLVSMVIILSGTLLAAFASFSVQQIRAVFRVAWNAYSHDVPEPRLIVDTLKTVSITSRKKGRFAVEAAKDESTISFMKNALGMLVDGYKDEEIGEILATEMFYFQKRRALHERVFRQMARLAPAFGVVGSIIGLVDMLSSINDPDVVLKTIPIALTSTLYGILLANMVFTPVAEQIHGKTQKELLMQRLIMDGVSAIYHEHNSHKLAHKLESFLTPSERPQVELSFGEIRDKLQERHGGMQTGQAAADNPAAMPVEMAQDSLLRKSS